MQITLLDGYPDFIGKRAAFTGYGTGPASYSQTTGDTVVFPRNNWYIDSVSGSVNSVSGTYYVRPQPAGTGARQAWVLHWYVVSTNAEVANAVNLSTEKVQFSGFCGQY